MRDLAGSLARYGQGQILGYTIGDSLVLPPLSAFFTFKIKPVYSLTVTSQSMQKNYRSFKDHRSVRYVLFYS